MEIKATGLPKTIEDYQVALNAAFAGGKAYGLAQREWVGLTDEDIREVLLDFPRDFQEWYDRDFVRYTKTIEAKLKEKNT